MTIRMYGPVTANGLNMNSINVDANCAGIMCVNRSLYFDAYVSLQSARPLTVPAGGIGGTGSISLAPSDTNTWQMYIPPGHTFTLPIPDERAFSNMIAPYSIGPGTTGSGTIWFAAVPYYQNNPAPPTGQQNQALGPTGFADVGYCLLTFFTWDIGDDPPIMTASSLTSEMTGQPRIVALPPSPAFGLAHVFTSPTAATWTSMGSPVAIGNFPFNLTSTNAGINGFVNISTYALTISSHFSAVTFQSQRVGFRYVILDHTSAIVSSLTAGFGWDGDLHIAESFTSSTTNSGDTFCAGGIPITIGLTIAAGAGSPYSIQPQFNVFANSGGPFDVAISATYDIAGNYPPTAGSLFGPNGTLTAIAYNQYQGFSY